MIRPLRRRHRVIVSGLAVGLPLAFLAGVAARKPVPVTATLPAALAIPAHEFGRVVWTKLDLWPGQRISTSLRRDPAGSVAVDLMSRDLVKPDVLVYWAAGQAAPVEGLPEAAQLLGALWNGVPLPIPAEARGEAGRFMLYSLADREVVAASSALVIQKD